MPRIKTEVKTVYTFDELSDRAKDRARAWYREGIEFDPEYTIEDAVRMGAILGITIGTRTYKTMGGGTGSAPVVYWDTNPIGAGFNGAYSYTKGASKTIRAEAPLDTDLHAIADTLQTLQRKYFYRVSLQIVANRRDGTHIDVEWSDPVTDEDADRFLEAIRDFAGWIATNINREYEYQYSDACIDENIEANEYEFTEDGRQV